MTPIAPLSYQTELFENSHECIMKGQLAYDPSNILVNGLWHYKETDPGEAKVSISTQCGCAVHCPFCSVPAFQANVTPLQAVEQTRIMLQTALRSGVFPAGIRRLKIATVKMGDAAMNPNLLPIIKSLIDAFRSSYGAPKIKISTMFPGAPIAYRNMMEDLIPCARTYADNGGILSPQFSIHATDNTRRQQVTQTRLASLSTIREFGDRWHEQVGCHNGRKPTLAFTLNNDTAAACHPSDLTSVLSPEKFTILIRGIVADILDTLSPERFASLSGEFQREGYTVIDGRATQLELENRTEVGLYNLLPPPSPFIHTSHDTCAQELLSEKR